MPTPQLATRVRRTGDPVLRAALRLLRDGWRHDLPLPQLEAALAELVDGARVRAYQAGQRDLADLWAGEPAGEA